MSIQTTIRLSREEAEQLLINRYIENAEARAKEHIVDFTDKELEDAIESTFDNYTIEEE